jgi:hypothetical protein
MEVTDYLVTLCIRRAELSGLKELPGSTKDRLTPLVLLAIAGVVAWLIGRLEWLTRGK